MRLISLNTWGGRVAAPLKDFFARHAHVDIFLLQEIFNTATPKTKFEPEENERLFEDIQELLPEHRGFFAPVQDGEWGLAAFVHSGVHVEHTEDIFVHRYRDAMQNNDAATLGRSVQRLDVATESGAYTLLNFHGLWTGINKNDNDDRLAQSRNIVALLRGIEGKKVLAGDFNLNPETSSVQIIENEGGMRNLVREYGATGTRTSYYKKPERFADYIFTTPDIAVAHFEVLPDEVSDHAALYLEFDV